MRYALISDVHANQQALNVVLTDVLSVGVDRIVSLGDLVGYGPDPAAVLEKAHARVDHFVIGNHDAVIAGLLDPGVFNERARRMIDWTAERLDGRAADFLKGHPYALTGPGCRCTHGNPVDPGVFGYVLEDADASAAWAAHPEQVLFVGHSHVPGIFVVGRSGVPHWLEPQDFAAEPHKRYIVNVGSVGQPRSGDIRACYCVFDDERREVRFRQVPFDLEAYRQALAAAAVPEPTAYFLDVADAVQPPPLREMLDFRPPAAGASRPADLAVVRLDRAVRSARRWQLGAVVLGALLVVAMGVAWQVHRRSAPEFLTYPAAASAALPAPPRGGLCLPASNAGEATRAGGGLQHWTVRLRDAASQGVSVEPIDGSADTAVRIGAAKTLPVVLESRPVAISAGMRFQVQARCRAGADFAGHAEIRLLLECGDGTSRLILHYPLDNLPREGWKQVRKSSPPEGLPADGLLRWVLVGEFSGELLLRNCDLKRTE